jgi:hypothetical protein
MLILTILRAAETQLPRLRVRRFRAYASIVCRAVCHAWLTIFHGRHNIDTLTAAALTGGRMVVMYINGHVVTMWLASRQATGKYYAYHTDRHGFVAGAAWFATIADVKKYLKSLAV